MLEGIERPSRKKSSKTKQKKQSTERAGDDDDHAMMLMLKCSTFDAKKVQVLVLAPDRPTSQDRK